MVTDDAAATFGGGGGAAWNCSARAHTDIALPNLLEYVCNDREPRLAALQVLWQRDVAFQTNFGTFQHCRSPISLARH